MSLITFPQQSDKSWKPSKSTSEFPTHAQSSEGRGFWFWRQLHPLQKLALSYVTFFFETKICVKILFTASCHGHCSAVKSSPWSTLSASRRRQYTNVLVRSASRKLYDPVIQFLQSFGFKESDVCGNLIDRSAVLVTTVLCQHLTSNELDCKPCSTPMCSHANEPPLKAAPLTSE